MQTLETGVGGWVLSGMELFNLFGDALAFVAANILVELCIRDRVLRIG